jgi:putative transcriptional regulator
MSTLGNRMRILRGQAGLTQEALASKSGVTATTIAAIEQGRRHDPHIGTIMRLARALGVDIQELFKEATHG